MSVAIAAADSPPVAPIRTRRRRSWLPLAFILPATALVIAVSIYPVFDAVLLSLYATRYAEKLNFVGLANYVSLLGDSSIWDDALTAVIYTAGSLVLVIPYALGIALLLNRPMRFRGVVRTLAILPWVFSQTVTALLWGWLLNPEFGPITYASQQLTGAPAALLASPTGAMAALIGVNVWSSYPMAALLFLAAIQTIPSDLYEAMRMDGAGPVALFRHITVPMIMPTLVVVLIQLTLLYFNMVTLVYVLTGGGPVGSTQTLALRVLKMSFENWDLGKGAALGLVLTFINLALSLFYVNALRSPQR
jgi:multiple sugar transport system permease protein